MADNVNVAPDVVGEVVPQSVVAVATDEVGSAHYQVVKLAVGPANSVVGHASASTPLPISIADSGNLDSFSRLRVSMPEALFDAQFTYNLNSLLFEPITAESGASVAHDATNRCALMTFSSTPANGKAYMQSYEHVRYQPGKAQLAFITFNFIEAKADCLKFAGLSTGANGIEFQLSGSTKQFVLYSDTGNGDQTVIQSAWNLDTLDGNGASRINLDITKVQIFVIDYQALYVGRVRVGFDIGGVVVYAHEFKHANLIATPYIQTANLPVRCGMTCSGTVSTTMRFICCSVASEGGQEETNGLNFSIEGTGTAGNGARAHILSVRPATTFNSIANRMEFQLESVDITVTGTNPILWDLCIGQAISGTTTFNAVNATYSGFEYNTAGTISGAAAISIAQGYIAASATTKQSVSRSVAARYPITLDAAGAVRALGTLSICAFGIGGTSATRAVMNWKELR